MLEGECFRFHLENLLVEYQEVIDEDVQELDEIVINRVKAWENFRW